MTEAGRLTQAVVTLKICILWAPDAPEPKPQDTSIPIGLRITILGACDLVKPGTKKGLDTYCTASILGKSGLESRTAVAKDTQAPMWNHVHEFAEFYPDDSLLLCLFEDDQEGEEDIP